MRKIARKLAALFASGAMLVTGVSVNSFSVNALTVIAQIEEIRVEDAEIAVGETIPVEVIWDKITGSTGAKSGLYFTSDSPDIAAVDYSSGNITGVSPGTAVITAINSPSEKSLTITVTDGTEAPPEYPEALPDWIPQNFNEALEFNNQYGKTHIEDGILCYVWQEKDDVSYRTTDTLGTDSVLSDQSYTYVLPEKPDESDTEAYARYVEELKSVGFNEYFADNGYLPDFKYHVTVYTPHISEDEEFTIERASDWDGNDEPDDIETLSFRVGDGEVTETDILGWLPDCITEYNDFLEKNGAASIHGNNIVYCADVNYSTGSNLAMDQDGTAVLEKVTTSQCSKLYAHDLFAGETSYFIDVYQPVSDGTVDVTWRVKLLDFEWNPDNPNTVRKKYEVSENGSVITDVTNGRVMGDVNIDGEFSIADVLLLQKWLLAAPDTSLSDWKAADFCQDGRLDVFDLSMMKKALLDVE